MANVASDTRMATVTHETLNHKNQNNRSKQIYIRGKFLCANATNRHLCPNILAPICSNYSIFWHLRTHISQRKIPLRKRPYDGFFFSYVHACFVSVRRVPPSCKLDGVYIYHNSTTPCFYHFCVSVCVCMLLLLIFSLTQTHTDTLTDAFVMYYT